MPLWLMCRKISCQRRVNLFRSVKPTSLSSTYPPHDDDKSRPISARAASQLAAVFTLTSGECFRRGDGGSGTHHCAPDCVTGIQFSLDQCPPVVHHQFWHCQGSGKP